MLNYGGIRYCEVSLKNYIDLLNAAVPLITTWYRSNKRPLPWRSDPTPYHVWVSEIMLQQTRIEAVIPYYYRFLETLPNVAALAEVEDDVLMKLWQGLGYYSRARNLKKAAIVLRDEYNGKLPEDAAALKRLPGIGDYTAGAIASIAYHQPEPAVDGNVLRVIMRLCACDDDIMLSQTKAEVIRQLRCVYPSGEEASLLTEGLMELGEGICPPSGAPQCKICPLHFLCRAYEAEETVRYPVRSPKKARRIEERTVLILSSEDRFALCKRPDSGLLAGLWEYPNFDGVLDKAAILKKLEELGVFVQSISNVGAAKHIFSHVEWHMQGYHISCSNQCPHFSWKSSDEIRIELAIPTAFRFYTNQILEGDIL